MKIRKRRKRHGEENRARKGNLATTRKKQPKMEKKKKMNEM